MFTKGIGDRRQLDHGGPTFARFKPVALSLCERILRKLFTDEDARELIGEEACVVVVSRTHASSFVV